MKVTIDLSNDTIPELTLEQLEKLLPMVRTSITIAKKKAKKNNPQLGLFGTSETNSEIKTTFENSNASNKRVFEKELLQAEQMGVDIQHYYQSVVNWSLKNTNIKRTARGWIATAQDFIRSDNQKKKVVMIGNVENEIVNTDAMLAYLNM